jgi:hypothetical protein
VAEHAAVLERLFVAVRDGLAFRPAAHAVRKQEQRCREAKTEPLC